MKTEKKQNHQKTELHFFIDKEAFKRYFIPNVISLASLLTNNGDKLLYQMFLLDFTYACHFLTCLHF